MINASPLEIAQPEARTAGAAGPLRIVIVGHVDHGKSTLVGRLFYDTDSLPSGKFEQMQEVCRRRGISFEWAFLMDAFQSERDQNVTIDTAQAWFRTGKRPYVIIDAPGHREFLKNMVTGAAAADAALLLIAANEGVQDQSRQHGYLLSLLGIRQVAVAVNKMDLIHYDRETFLRIETEYRDFLKHVGLESQAFIPISAREGENLAAGSTRMPWYRGPTLLEILDQFEAPGARPDLPLRFPVQDVYRFDHRRILAGRIEAGNLKVGDTLIFWPHHKSGVVKSIETWNASPKTVAAAGESVGITLTEQIFVERGDVASHEQDLPLVTNRFQARLFWLGKSPLRKGKKYKLKLVTQEVECRVATIEKIVNAATLQPIAGRDHVERNEVAELTLFTKHPVVLDNFARVAETGRFVLVDEREVSGGGIIHRAVYPDQAELESRAAAHAFGDVALEHRENRHGHRGGIVWLTAKVHTELPAVARKLERILFNRGMSVFVMDSDNLFNRLNSDLGYSPGDRAESMRRAGEISRLFAGAGFIVIAALHSPYRVDRQRVRQIAQRAGCEFVEIRVDSPGASPSVESRLPQGVFAGSDLDFTDLTVEYEHPENPDHIIPLGDSFSESVITPVVESLIETFQLPPLDYVI